MTKHQAGLSLVELLIAMALSLILMTGVISIFISAKQGYSNQDATAQVQESGRFALDIMSREIRMAGYGGCSDSVSVANTLDGDAGFAETFSQGLQGYEIGSDPTKYPTELSAATEDTDAIIVHTVDSSSDLSVTSHNPNAATIHVSEAHSLKEGNIMVLVDSNCSNMAIFAYTGPANVNDNATNANHNTGAIGADYQNCTKALKGNFDCDDTSSAVKQAYSVGSALMTMDSFAFYVAPSALDPSVNSLYRLNIGGDSEELVEGVSDLEIYYGLASSLTTMRYKKAGSVGETEWPDVKSVRLIITTSSITKVGGSPLSKTYTSTTMLRNRGEET